MLSLVKTLKTSTCSPGATLLLSVLVCASPQWGRAQSPLDTNHVPAAVASEPHATVSLYLALRDRKGKRIPDLKPADLAVNDAGRAIDSRELRIENATVAGDPLITLIFDHLDGAGAKNAARAARSILKNLGDAPGGIGVWAIDGRLRVLQSYTADRNLVATAITAATGESVTLADAANAQEKLLLAAENAGDADARASKQKRWDRSSIDALNDAQNFAAERHVPWGIAGLYGAAQAQRRMSGRKVILYFTEVVPSDLNAADMFRAAAQQLMDASVSVFAIDLNALDASAMDGLAASAAMGQTASYIKATVAAETPLQRATQPMGMTPTSFKVMNDTIADIEFDGMVGTKNLLAQLAEATGGAYTNADASSKKMCRRIVDDLSSYYTVTYPRAGHPDGRFHPVTVKLLRSGVRLEARPGYFASAAADVSSGSAAEASLIERPGSSGEFSSLVEGITASELLVRSAMLRFGKASVGMHNVVALEVPTAQLQFHEDANTALFSLHASVAAEIRNASGTPVARFHEEYRRRGSKEFTEKLRAEVLSMERSVNLPPGDYQLDAVVRDWNADKIGRSTQSVHLAETSDTTILSDLVLVRSTDEKNGDAGASTLPYGRDHVIPNLSGELPGGSRAASIYFQLYPGKNAAADTLRIDVSKGGKVIASLPMRMAATQGLSRVANVTLGSSGGAYEVTVVLEHGAETSRRHLTIVDHTGPAASPHAAGETREAYQGHQ